MYSVIRLYSQFLIETMVELSSQTHIPGTYVVCTGTYVVPLVYHKQDFAANWQLSRLDWAEITEQKANRKLERVFRSGVKVGGQFTRKTGV